MKSTHKLENHCWHHVTVDPTSCCNITCKETHIKNINHLTEQYADYSISSDYLQVCTEAATSTGRCPSGRKRLKLDLAPLCLVWCPRSVTDISNFCCCREGLVKIANQLVLDLALFANLIQHQKKSNINKLWTTQNLHCPQMKRIDEINMYRLRYSMIFLPFLPFR